MPFREAHDAVGRIVLHAIAQGVELDALPLEVMRAFSSLIEDDVYEALSLEKTLATKTQKGGTAPERVMEALHSAHNALREK
jgi:argininosuccinate lyase